MLLSDLPVELLQTILQHLIPEWPGVQDDHDEIREALGLRLVCKGFDRNILRCTFAEIVIDFQLEADLLGWSPGLITRILAEKARASSSQTHNTLVHSVRHMGEMLAEVFEAAGTSSLYRNRAICWDVLSSLAVIHKGKAEILNGLKGESEQAMSRIFDHRIRVITLLVEAHDGNIAMVNKLLGYGVYVNESDDLFGHALTAAAYNGHAETVRRLLESKANPLATGEKGLTAIHWAALKGRAGVMQELLGVNGMNPNIGDEDGRTPLHLAAKMGHDDVVALLLKHDRVIPDATDNGLRTPLWWAAVKGREGCVRLLLANEDVDPTHKDNDGRSIIWRTVHGGPESVKLNLKVIELLLQQDGVEAEEPNDSGHTLLEWAGRTGNEGLMKILLAREEINLKTSSHWGMTILHWAAESGKETLVRLLFERDISVLNQRSESYRRTPLHFAAIHGHNALVKLLLTYPDIEVNPRDASGETPLWLAAANSQAECVSLLLAKEGIEPDAKADSGLTPFLRALYSEDETVPELLLRHGGVDMHAKCNGGDNAISIAASRGCVSLVRYLIGKGADVKSKNDHGRTALHGAAGTSSTDVVEELLKSGADPNTRDNYGESPLGIAISSFDMPLCQLLLNHGADINVQDDAGQTPLHRVVTGGNVEFTTMLLDRGASQDIKTNAGHSPLQLAARMSFENIVILLLTKRDEDAESVDWLSNVRLLQAAAAGDEELVKALVEKKGIDLDFEDNYSQTPLLKAAQAGQHGAMRILLDRGAKATHLDLSSMTPLHWAMRNGHTEAALLLCECEGVDPNFAQEQQGSPFLEAVQFGRRPIVEAFLQRGGINIEQKSPDGLTALAIAEKIESSPIFQLLIEAGADPHVENGYGYTLLASAASHNSPLIAGMLLARNDIDPNTRIGDQPSALSVAVGRQHEGIVNLLLQHPQIQPNIQNNDNFTPLRMAVHEGNHAIVNILLAHPGVEVNARDEKGMAPLHCAVEHGHEQVARLLLARPDTDANATDRRGLMPLHRATEHGQLEMVRMLLAHGVDVRGVTHVSDSALRVAASNGYPEIMELLVERCHDLGELEIVLNVAAALGDMRSALAILSRIVNLLDISVPTSESVLPSGVPRSINKRKLLRSAVEGRSEPVWRYFMDKGWLINDLDENGWSLGDVVRQAGFRIAERTKDGTRIILPPGQPLAPDDWVQVDGRPVVDVSNEVVMHNDGIALPPQQSLTAPLTIRANRPFLPRAKNSTSYFEIEILTESTIGIGICGDHANVHNAMPGWHAFSWGYHGDDGMAYIEVGQGKPYGPIFSRGDVVGCGVDWKDNAVFWVLNGKRFLNIRIQNGRRRMWPVVGMIEMTGSVRANFGERPFLWNGSPRVTGFR